MSATYHAIDESAIMQRLDNYLIKKLKGVPKSHIYQIIRKGNVRINKARKKPDYKLQLDDVIRIPPIRLADKKNIYVSKSLEKILVDSIIYQDKGLIAINKPSGLASHSGSGIKIGLIEALRELYGNHLELVHRLDRATSGCLLIAKKRSVLINLQLQLQQGNIYKRYIALLKNAWQKKQYQIDAPIGKQNNKIIITNDGVSALSYFHPIKNIYHNDFNLALTQVIIKTGRMHQIRVHAQYAKHPIVGDDKYGDIDFNAIMAKLGIKRLCLHAEQLKFINPTTNKKQQINSKLDTKLQDTINKL